MIRTPPMLGSMTFSMSANFMSSCSATFTNGREGILDALPLTSANAATAETISAKPLLRPRFAQSSRCTILTHFCSLLEGRCRARKECEASVVCVLPLQDAMLSRKVCIVYCQSEINLVLCNLSPTPSGGKTIVRAATCPQIALSATSARRTQQASLLAW